MKKITTLISSLLFLFSTLICNAQQILPFSTEDYFFPDENEIISPSTNYRSIFIVFSENTLDASIVQFEALHPELIQNDNHSFPQHNYKLYTLEQSHRNTAEIAEAYLAKLRVEPAISSVYPAFLRNGETAFLDKQFLLSLRKEDASREKVSKLLEAFKGEITEELDMVTSTTYAISVPADVNIFTACSELHKLPEVLFAQPNFYFSGKVDFIPNDPMFSDQWFLNQNSDADIDAAEAWDITTGSASIAVAVIDGHGFDLEHAEMSGKYLSPYNAVDNNNNPTAIDSEENHGTPCAGLIGALTNNSVGVASVAYNVMVIPIKMGFDFGSGGTFLTSVIVLTRACEHVMTAPYSIVAVSNSYILGSWANITSIRDAYSHMRTNSREGLGTVVLASTGNDDAMNTEGFPFRFAHVVGVGSTDRYDSKSSFSNYGDSTDVCAPGTDTWTLDRSGTQGYSINDYYEFSGTSAACPIAAGVVGLIGSVHPEYTELQMRTQLYNSCEKVGGYSYTNNSNYPFGTWSIQLGYGRVNAYEAVLGGGSPLDPPTNLEADVSGNNVHLNWTAPGGGGGTQEELIYDNNISTGAYKYLDYTMSTQMSPSGPCQVLTLKYYTTNEGDDKQFYAKVFNWAGSQPGTTVLHNSTEVALDGSWVEVDVSGSGINVSEDFVVGFGSFSEQAYIAYDENLNNGRSWDLQESSQTWTSWNEAYLIRAVVLYPSGKIEILGGKIPETISHNNKNTSRNERGIHAQNTLPIPNQYMKLKGLLGYKVYRDGSPLNSSPISDTNYDDTDLPGGTYAYTVTAVYDEGESNPVGPVNAVVLGIPLDPPQNLQTSVNGSSVNLSWSSPAGGTEQWLYYHDGTFENSFASIDGGTGLAQRFTLSSIPATLNEIRFFTSDYQLWGKTLSVYIIGNSAYTVLGGPYIVKGVENGWVHIPTSVFINESNFMIATYNDEANGPYIAVDDSYFNNSLFFGNHIGGFTELSQLGDYKYVGSHEAKVLYAKKSGRVVTEWIKPSGAVKKEGTLDIHQEKVALSAPYPEGIKALLGYNIYRDGSKINSSTWTSTAYTDPDLANGTYAYGVTAVYDEGESDVEGPVDVVVNNQGMPAPTNLSGYINGNIVNLNWIGPGGSNEELIYDNGTTTGAYNYPGFTMSTHFSPSGPCQILTLKYLTTINSGGSNFHARIFNWAGTEPGNLFYFYNNVQAIEGWLELDISGDNLMVDGDFVVGFASLDTLSFLGFDGNLNNGRSWDYNETNQAWSTWDEAYLIRAVVQYSDGTKAELGKVEGLLGYNLYRNNIKVNSSLIINTHATDELLGWGEYTYNVTAVYNEAQSAFSNDFTVNFYFGIDEPKQIDARVYPNPSDHIVFIESSEEIESISLYTIAGKSVMSVEETGTEMLLDVSNLDAGLYLLKIQTAEGTGVYKLLVK